MKELEGPKLGKMDSALAGMARKMWAPALVMGVMIIVIAFLVGLMASSSASEYFEASKIDRDTAAVGTALVDSRVQFMSVKAWLPPFKFLGMGLIFSGIIFLLATIIDALRRTGYSVQKAIGSEIIMPKKPWTGQWFPPVMMMGLMLLIGTFIVGLYLGGETSEYWNHVIKTELDAAVEGSALLSQLALISSIKAWLTPLLFVGVALLLTSIGLALDTIRRTLKAQSIRLLEINDQK